MNVHYVIKVPTTEGVMDHHISPPTSPKEEAQYHNEGYNSLAASKVLADDKKQNGENEDPFADDDDEDMTKCGKALLRVQNKGGHCCKANSSTIWLNVKLGLLLFYLAWAICAMYRDFDRAIPLLAIICMFAFFGFCWFVLKYFGTNLNDGCWKPLKSCFSNPWKYIKWVLVAVIVALIIFFLIYDNYETPNNLISVAGLAAYVLLLFVFSYNPAKVKWQPVLGGLLLQFVFALLILRTRWGFDAFKWLGKQVEIFLGYTDAGSKFVFGDQYTMHFFAFKVLPVVVFFSSAISVLYYLGWMQIVIYWVALVLRTVMGTTAGESLNAAGNIFIGQSEAPLMIRPMIQHLTLSEMHAVMTGGFATIAGSVMATYILFGVPANHLLSASVMSAPAALAMSKLFYPETQKSKTTTEDLAKLEKSQDHNIIQAASNGAIMSIQLVANIAVNLIAFIAFLEFFNAVLIYHGGLIGLEPPKYEPFTFQFICSYVLYPFAFLMGADVADCRQVASLLGIKTFLNEFVAYGELSTIIKNRKTYDDYMTATNFTGVVEQRTGFDMYLVGTNTTLVGGTMSLRSEVISTYALCGFANVGSIGIMVGALGALAPNRKTDISRIVVRAMIAGNVACFMTACIAGVLYEGEY